MELLYVTQSKSGNRTTSNLDNVVQLSSVSSNSIVTFTSSYDLNSSSNNSNNLGHYVYVADLNEPWYPYKILSNKVQVSCLGWDISGKYIMIGDHDGNVLIAEQKDNLLSEWKISYSTSFPGEHIIKGLFFHNGRKMNIISSEKKEQHSYFEKYQKIKFLPSVMKFGSAPVEGCVIITSSGLVGAFLIPSKHEVNQKENDTIIVTNFTESLSSTRNFYTIADICYGKSGNFKIVLANTDYKTSSNIIKCFNVSIRKISDALEISSISLPSFFINEGLGKDLKDLRCCCLNWAYIEDVSSIIIASNYNGGCFIEQWELIDDTIQVHKIFQSKNDALYGNQCSSLIPLKTMQWISKNHYRYNNTKVIEMCSSKINYAMNTSTFIYAAMNDGSIHCLSKDSFKRVAITNINTSRESHDHNKQMKTSICFASLCVSYMGHLLICFDKYGQIYTYKCNFVMHDIGQALVNQTVNLLEYCLITGFDYLDILLTIKPQIIDSIPERLTDNFSRQSLSVQQYFYTNFIAMKISLYRLSQSGHQKAQDLSNFLMLHSILIAFKSLLRPSDLTTHDKGPVENLAMVLADSDIFPDVDKVLLNLEAKDFTVEPSLLQSLQLLIQWVADLALNILAKLPENRGAFITPKTQGYELTKDIVALNSLRELLVMIRIWGLLNPACLPVFSKSENLDVLLTLFRLLTKLALNPNEVDEILLDECCLIPSQVVIPPLQSVSVASPLYHVSHPLFCTYNVEDEYLKYYPEYSSFESRTHNIIIDSVRYQHLGKRPKMLRKCTRCGSYSQLITKTQGGMMKTAAIKAWELRWADKCRCNGLWKIEIN